MHVFQIGKGERWWKSVARSGGRTDACSGGGIGGISVGGSGRSGALTRRECEVS